MQRRSNIACAALVIAVTVGLGAVSVGRTTNLKPANVTTLSVIGDVPYNADQLAAFPAWIEDINGNADVEGAVHLGDIKSGSMVCSDDYFTTIAGLFGTFEDPLVFTPGDNEWTDCHRPTNGSYNPLERLAKLRDLFFPKPGITLGKKKHVHFQRGYPENVEWKASKTVFSAVHVVGSNNGLAPWTGNTQPTPEQLAEVEARIHAALAWIDSAFDTARKDKAHGVVLMMQADTFQGSNESLPGFAAILERIETRAAAFDGRVLLLQGDSHVFLVDSPLSGAPNVTRIVVEGDVTADEWLKLTVDPRSPEHFSWERIQFQG